VPLTTAHWLTVLAPHLTEPLFGPEALARLARLGSSLPGECRGILEVRLASGAPAVDLSLRLHTAGQAHGMAARLPPSPGRDFLARWSAPEDALSAVRAVWLELDLDRDWNDDAPPAPILCARLPRNAAPGWLPDTLLPALTGRPLPAARRRLILACLDLLPPAARLLYVFDLQARGTDAVRLEVFGLQPAEILAFLRDRVPATAASAATVLPLFAGVERLHLSFDLAEEILPRIGIEGSFPRQPSREPRWAAWLDRLAQRGLCSPEKRDAVLAWPGYDTFWTAPRRWPVAEIGPRGVCLRALSHLKAVCRPQHPPEAKAYLVFGPPDLSSADLSSDDAPATSPSSRSALSA
jgi:hypothetical protein